MSQVKRNIIANFLGRGWSSLMALAFIPLYIELMGIEAYGLVGLFATLQAMFSVLDLGLTTTLNREMARYSVQTDKAQEMRDLVRTLETLYWAMAIVIGTIVFFCSSFIAREWIQAEVLSISTVQNAIRLMGFVIAFQWPLAFYSGGLLGLQRQALYNGLDAIWATLRFAGAVLVLLLISPTIEAFFTYQVVVSAVSTFLTALALWYSLPSAVKWSSFRANLLRSIGGFTIGISAISLSVLFLTQLDKIILSKLLSLEMFGYYTLAWTVAGGLTKLSSPIFIALFPTFSQRVVSGETQNLQIIYHRSCQLMSIVILPVAIMVATFASDILWIWTQNATTVENSSLLVTILIIGTALNGLMNLPYALQLAYGWTQLAFYANLIAITFLVPLLIVMSMEYGAIGAAFVWVLLNSGYVVFNIHFMHRRLLSGEQWRWYTEDVGKPLVAALVTVGLGSYLMPKQMSLSLTIVSLCTLYFFTLIASTLAASQIREWLFGQIKNYATNHF